MDFVAIGFHMGQSIVVCFWKAGLWLRARGNLGSASAFWCHVECDLQRECHGLYD